MCWVGGRHSGYDPYAWRTPTVGLANLSIQLPQPKTREFGPGCLMLRKTCGSEKLWTCVMIRPFAILLARERALPWSPQPKKSPNYSWIGAMGTRQRSTV